MADLVRNDNFVKLLGFCTEPKAIIMPVYNLGDFSDLIYSKKASLEQKYAVWNRPFVTHLLADIANALEYLHSKDISHNDVKPTNALLDQRKDRLHLVLSDFSFAEIRSQTKRGVKAFPFSEADGLSFPYAAPEIFNVLKKKNTHDELLKNPVHSRDTYAFGIVIYEAVSRRFPYTKENTNIFIAKILGGDRPDYQSFLSDKSSSIWKPYIDLAIECWAPTPESRPRLNRILNEFQKLLK